MDDLETLSDADLDKLILQKAGAQPEEMDYSSLSDEDLDQMVMQKLEEQTPQDRSGEAFTQNFGNAVSMGYLPQIQAATEPVIQGALDFFGGDNTDEKLKEQGFQIEEVPQDSYVQRRDKNIANINQLSQENPMASMAGGISGAVVSGIATGGGLSKLLGTAGKATTMGKRLANAAKTGAAIGIARNPGDTEGEVNVTQIDERLANAGKDAATGMLIQGGAEALRASGNAIKNSAKNLKEYSQNKALKSSGAMLKDFRKAVGKKKVGELGQAAIDENIVGIGDDVADIAKKAESAQKSIGSKIGSIYDKADDVTSISQGDMRKFNDDFLEESYGRLKGTIGGEKVAQKLDDVLSVIRDNKNPSFSELRKFRSSIDDEINYSKQTQDLPQYQEELLHLRNKVQEMVQAKIGQASPELKRQLVKENKRFSNIAEIAKISKDKMAREESNAAFGLRERISGGAGGVVGSLIGSSIGGPIGAAVGAGAGAGLGTISTKIARQYGTPFVAITANKVARALEKNQDALGKLSKPLIEASNNPEKFVATINMMMKKPEFKRKMEGLESDTIYRGPARR